jgi:hypothetical protein
MKNVQAVKQKSLESRIDHAPIKDHVDGFGKVTGKGKTIAIHEYVLAGLRERSPARATYLSSLFKHGCNFTFPRGCKF